jgi:hypothetical protein
MADATATVTAPAAAKVIDVLKLYNATQSPLQFNLTKYAEPPKEAGRIPQPPKADTVTVDALNVLPVVVEGERARRLQRLQFFIDCVDQGLLTVNRDVKASEVKRAPSEPEPPADLVGATQIGNVVKHVAGMDVEVLEFKHAK